MKSEAYFATDRS